MIIIPYKSIGALNFWVSENEAISLLGEPYRRTVYRRNEDELSYESAVYRFDRSIGLVECSATWSDVVLYGVNVPMSLLPSFIRENDPNAKETVGFLISPAYGISIDLEHSGWISVFSFGLRDKFLS